MIMPAKWYTGGKGLDDFREKMLSDKHITNLYDYFDSFDVFPLADISGGVCYFLWNSASNDENCHIVSFFNGLRTEMDRSLNENEGSFIRLNQAVSIMKKVRVQKEDKFYSTISTRKPFGLDTKPKGLHSNKDTNDIKIFAYPNDGYINRNLVKQNSEWVDLYKVCVSYAYGERGDFPYFAIGKPFIAEPQSCCSETYLVVYTNSEKDICENVSRYMRTRFFRFIVLLKKNTQHATKTVYEFVPVQDFTANSDIDWSKPIPDIDKQLYAKYGLTEEEIVFIEGMIKPME